MIGSNRNAGAIIILLTTHQIRGKMVWYLRGD